MAQAEERQLAELVAHSGGLRARQLRRDRPRCRSHKRRDRGYAMAYAGLADCCNLLPFYGDRQPKETYPKARAAALRALELNSRLAEAHTSLAAVQQWFEWDKATEHSDGHASCRAYVAADPWGDPLRADPRFSRLARAFNLVR
jgi:hypothetical protein